MSIAGAGDEPVCSSWPAGATASVWVDFASDGTTIESRLATDPCLLDDSDPGVDLKYTDRGVTGRISAPGVSLQRVSADGREFTRLAVPGWGLTSGPGRAELPVFRTSLIIPDDVAVVADYTINRSVSLGSGHLVYPVQPPASDTPVSVAIDAVGTATGSEFAYDADYYRGAAASETGILTLSDPFIARGTSVVLVGVSPFQYDPVTGEITVATDLEISLDFVTSGPSDGGSDASPGSVDPPPTDLFAEAADADYLIITADAFYEEVLPLAQWKQLKGFRTCVARLSDIGSSTRDVGDFIHDVYHTGTETSYVLLVGDCSDVPSNYVAGYYISDQPYACVDGGDYLPDLAIGRLPVQTEAEATTVVDKILLYDRTPDMGEWYDDAAIAGYFQDWEGAGTDGYADRWFMETSMHVHDYLKDTQGMTMHTALCADQDGGPPYYYRTPSYPHRISVTGDAPYPVPNDVVNLWTTAAQATADISAAVNAGVGLLQHRDHGSETAWSAPPFGNADVTALTNGVMTPVVLSISCATGTFDFFGGDCFAERILKHDEGGAVGVVAATRTSYSGYNDLLLNGMYTGFWPDYDPTHTGNPYPYSMRPAEALNFGKFYMLSYGGANPYAELEFNEFHWFGDPEMMLRTDTPSVLSVDHPTAMRLDTPTDVTIVVTDSTGAVEGAQVCISMAGTDDYWVGITDDAGSVTFTDLTAHEIGGHDVVVTAYNAAPYEGTIISVPRGPVADLITPPAGGATNVDLGYVDVEWLDFFNVGLDPTTIDAGDVSIAGTTVLAAAHQGGNVWRYSYSGALTPGMVDVVVHADEVQDNDGDFNVANVLHFAYDLDPPHATLSSPADAAEAYVDLGYVDVLLSDLGPSSVEGAGVDPTTLDAGDLTITNVTVTDPPVDLGDGIWRYGYSGDLPEGTVTVQFIEGEVLDLAGNPSSAHVETFTFSPLKITTPATLPRAALSEPYRVTLEAAGGVAPYGWSPALPLVITELGLGGPDYVEIQNTSQQTINTTGWVVVISDDFTDINSVNPTYWNLPPSIDGGAVLYRTDDTQDHYWGRNILFNAGNAGWAAILDDAGKLVDFVAWHWMAANLAAMDFIVAGHRVSVGDEFTGDGVVSRGSGSIQRQGNEDHNSAADFAWVSPASMGAQNAGLIVPFPSGGSIPDGLSLDRATGVISGRPTQTGSFDFAVMALDCHSPAHAATKLFHLQVVILPPLILDVPAQATEGDGTVQATVGIPVALGTNLTLSLSCDDISEVSVPDTVTIPAGQTEAEFEITIVDDSELDWFQSATIVASAYDYATRSDTIIVADNETAVLTVDLPASAAEGDGVLAGAGTVTASAAPTADVTVELRSNDTTEVTVPATVTLRAGQTSAVFDVTIVDDTAIDQTRTATIIARVENWTDGSASIDVIDNDNDLMLSVPAMAWEGDGVLTDAAVVSISSTLPTDVVVSLVSGDTSELTAAATVTIPAGSTSATFDLTVIDDSDQDGARPVTVTASAAGFNDGSQTMEVADDDVHHFTLDTIDTPQTASEPFGAAIRAKDVDDRTISVYAGTVGLHVTGDGGAVTVEPGAGTFAAGVWTGDVTVHAVDRNVVIAVDDGWGHTGASNPFDVLPGPLDHFVFSSIVSPQYVNIPFAATLTATDAHGYTTTGFQGTVDLSGLAEFGNVSIAITPTVTAFLDGAWTGEIAILEEADDVILRADDGAGHAGQSNILDVEAAPPLLVDVPADAAEGDAMVQGTLSILSALGDDLLVYLSSDDPSEATVPDTATILAGQTTATFEITLIDDAELDWFQEVRITATAAGHARGSDVMTVADNETATLTVDLPDSASEGDGVLSGTGTVTASAAPTSNVVVELNSEDTTEVIVPATVTIPAGRTSVTFNVRIVDDTEIDGTRSTTITARVANWTDGSDTMDVFDNEHLDLIVTLPAGAWEGDGVLAGAAAVSISGTLPTDLVVSLGSDDTSELNVPATATIPAGDTSVEFDVTVVDDSDSDGVQTATVSAAAAGFNDGHDAMGVADDEVHHFTFDAIGTPQNASEPLPVTIRARNLDDQAVPASVGPVNLGGDGDGGPAVVTPASSGPLVDGSWTGMVTVVAPDTNVVLTADDGWGHAGASNPFDVVPGPMDHLRLSTIATPQYVQLPFSATLTALDAHDYVATGFNGTVQLSGSVTAETTSTVVITECDLGSPDFIEIQNVSGHAVDTAGWVVAVSDSYSRIDDVNGTTWFLPPSMAAGEILYRTDDQADNYWGQNILFNVGNAGWAVIIDDTGRIVDAVAWDWATFRLNAMDALINGHHVTIGDEFSGGGISSSGAGTVQRSGDRDHNGVSDFAWLSPPSKGIQNSTLTVPFTGGTLPVAVTPTFTAAFTNGVWTGEISVLQEVLGMCLHADGGNGQVVDSNQFDVEIAPPLSVDIPALATEGDGVLQGIVSIPFALAVDLAVNLGCDDSSELTLPETATIPAGQIEATFEIEIVDDSELDWYQHPTVSASATGYLGGSDTITVADNEQAIVTVKLPRDGIEGDLLLGQGKVIASRAPTSDVVVDLSSEDTTELIVPATVTIPAGQLSATFDITVVDDTQIDATQNASIVARVDNWIYGTDSMDILDNESLDLVVTLPAGVWEGDGTLAGVATVCISGTLPADLVVSLASDDTGVLQVPPTATIPAGATSATFDLTMVDDADCDGAQAASVTAAAAGFNDGSRSTDVADDDVHHFTFDAIGTPQTASEPLPVTILARNVDHQTIPAYALAVSLSGAGQSGAVTVSPATTGTFAAGRWTGNVTVHAVDDQVVLTADDGLGHAGTSNAFGVVPGPLDHFGFSSIDSPRFTGAPLRLTITAQDAHGYTTSDFQGSAELSGWVGTGKAPRVMITECGLGNTDFIEIQNVSGEPLDTSGWVVAVSGSYAAIDQVNPVYWSLPPSMPAAEVLYRTDDEGDNYWGNNILWGPGSAGWAAIIDARGEVVDFVAWQWTAADVLAMRPGINGREIPIGEEFLGDGVGCTGTGTIQRQGNEDHNAASDFSWVSPASKGSVNAGLTTPFTGGPVPIAIAPTATSVFAAGVWTGEVTILEEAAEMYLRADDGNEHVSVSNTFDVLPPAEVVGRYVFYNNSSFDGNDPNPGPRDDDAIAPDKTALLPGQIATLANYTSYSRGLNGIMVDVNGLIGTPVAEDFRFKVGNDSDPQGWSTAPAPQSISVRPRDGSGGSDRVTIIWADGAIAKQWLEVTVLATGNTGLPQNHTFYFGNAVGEGGNSTSDAKVNAFDMLLARNHPRNFTTPAPIDFDFDYNRDARVNATDVLIARNNQTEFLDALKLIDLSDSGSYPSATDRVLERAAGGPDPMPPGKMAWLGEFEQISARGRGTGTRRPPERGGDEMFFRLFSDETYLL